MLSNEEKILKERGNFWLRFLDRYVGIPFLCFLSLFKGIKKRSGYRIENVLVIKIGGIGDTLLLIPILKAIKNTHEGVSLTVVCSKNNYEVLNRHQFIDN
ncbi:MAG: hypothetical protein HY578_03820, partial [Nitrospinae bacterium]|nr:hypothetical protein [Nitrospinota bacterium]